MIAGAGASAAGVHRLKRGCEQGPVQDTQTHDSAILQVGCRGMESGGLVFIMVVALVTRPPTEKTWQILGTMDGTRVSGG